MKNPLRATVTDHRGRAHPLVPLELFLTLGKPADRIRRLRAASREPLQTESIASQAMLGLLMFVGAFGCVALVTWIGNVLALNIWVRALTAAGVGLLNAYVMIHASRLFSSKRIVHVYIAAGCCASCGYDLRSVALDSDASDGCRVCPECGAAWRLDGVTKR